jgi:primosomal protein N''
MNLAMKTSMKKGATLSKDILKCITQMHADFNALVFLVQIYSILVHFLTDEILAPLEAYMSKLSTWEITNGLVVFARKIEKFI